MKRPQTTFHAHKGIPSY